MHDADSDSYVILPFVAPKTYFNIPSPYISVLGGIGYKLKDPDGDDRQVWVARHV